jgi:curved DNA-binding protein CbpA
VSGDAVFDPYKVLQVDSEADPDVIQAAYRRLAQKFHPDLAAGEGAERMVAINRAWEILRDPERRAAHDRERQRAAEGTPDAHAPAATAATGRMGATYPRAAEPRPTQAETVSRDWTSGRSTFGGGYDPSTMRAADGVGAAGSPPGNPSGSVLNFGRYSGWSLGEIGRTDVEYLEWLDRMPIGRIYRDEIDGLLRKAGRRRSEAPETTGRRGLFRRR